MIELQDGRYLDNRAIEIEAVPYYTHLDMKREKASEINSRSISRFLNEMWRLCPKDCVMAELLFLSESVENQTTKARVRMFFIVRMIGKDKSEIENILNAVKENFVSMLRQNSYRTVEIFTQDQMKDILSKYQETEVNGIVKNEKCAGGIQAPFPYYHCDIIPSVVSNPNSLFDMLSRSPGCAVSSQLFLTAYEQNEQLAMIQMADHLNQLTVGIKIGQGQLLQDSSAREPEQIYRYYQQCIGKPMFKYNLLVFGDKLGCANITARLASSLQSEENHGTMTDYGYVNLSDMNINLKMDWEYYPWNVNHNLIYTYRDKRLWNALRNYQDLFQLPYIISLPEAISLFHLPIDDDNISGIKRNLIARVKEQFSHEVTSADNIFLGNLADQENVRLGAPLNSFTKHGLIVGMPGTGKTTFSINLLLQMYRKGIPFLAIEPTKTEYRAMIKAIPDLQIFTPGNNMVSPFIINPFIPPTGVRLEQYIPSLASAFQAAFSMPSPLDMIFLSAIRKCYIEHGWKNHSMVKDTDVEFFGLYEFILTFKQIIQNSEYSAEVKGNIQSGGTLRLMNLLEQNSNIYDTINTVPLEDLLRRPTILELNAIDNAEQKSLIMALLLINICVYTKCNQVGDGILKNMILLDEAHVLLGKQQPISERGESQNTAAQTLQDMIREIRSYGTSIIIADQSPSKVGLDVAANTDIKVTFRLVQIAEKNIIADTTNMRDGEEQQLSKLGIGEAYVYYNLLEKPQLVKTEDIREKEHICLSVSNKEVAAAMHYWDSRRKMLRPFRECELCYDCRDECDSYLRSCAEFYAEKHMTGKSANISDAVALLRTLSLMQNSILELEEENKKKMQLCDCAKLQFIRKFILNKGIKLSSTGIKKIYEVALTRNLQK